MFSKPFRAVFYILAQAFMTLYKMPASWEPSDEHAEFTGADMMARALHGDDNPETGNGDGVPAVVNTPAQVFNSGSEVAAVFAPNLTAAQVAAVEHVPVYQMTAKAGPYSREQFHAQQWSDEVLLAQGYMVDVAPKPAAPSTAAAPLPPIAPTAPPPTLPPAAPAASPLAPPAAVGATTAAPAAPAPVEVDKDGMPWDARIHSGGRTQTAKGIWQRRKNVPDGTYAAVVAELRQRPATATAPAHVPLAPPAVHAPSAPHAPLAPAPAPAPAANVPTSFKELMEYAGANQLGSTFAAVGQAMGLVSFGLLAHETDPARFAEAYRIMVSLRP